MNQNNAKLASGTEILKGVNSFYVSIIGQKHQHNLAATVLSATDITAKNLLQPCKLLSTVQALCFHSLQTLVLLTAVLQMTYSLFNTIFYLYAKGSITTTWNKA